MTPPTTEELVAAMGSYAAGLEAELTLLRQLHDVAIGQRAVAAANDAAAIRRCTEQRDAILASLLAVEAQVAPLRQLIASNLERAAKVEGFAETSALHRVAERLVADIAASDHQTMDALRAAEETRRELSRALEVGGHTLAAYGRVVRARAAHASILDSRG